MARPVVIPVPLKILATRNESSPKQRWVLFSLLLFAFSFVLLFFPYELDAAQIELSCG